MLPAGSATHRVRLPEFPWGQLAPYLKQAAQHPGGIIDLSIGTPVDDTPKLAQVALQAASNAPGYPQTAGTAALQHAIVSWFARCRNVTGLDTDAVLPTIGSKELVSLLPTQLGLGSDDYVVHPKIAYPTYDIGARLAGATPLPADQPFDVGPARVGLIWVNSPSNPTGEVLSVEQLARIVQWGREIGAVVASDECYAQLPWDVAEVPSILDPRVCGGIYENLLAVYSVSKQSNLAGYRGAFLAGDREIVQHLLEIRKHGGMMMPAPVQAALAAVLEDDDHVAQQRERYRHRRELVKNFLLRNDFDVSASPAGLYLWASAGESCWDTVAKLAHRGILVAPGIFYGPDGAHHIRVGLTAPDERIENLASR